MAKAFQKSVVFALAVLIALGSVSNAVAGALSCLPKTCCCAAKTQDKMVYPGRMDMEMPQGCAPNTPAPCCRVEPFQPNADLAISSQPPYVPQRMSWGHMIVDDTVKASSLQRINICKSLLDAGPLLKIPFVPIYLQTLSILC